MGSKVLITAICWLALCDALEVQKKVNSSIVKDNESAESAPPLYARPGNVIGVYASTAPYGAFSYNSPAVIKAPLTAGSQVAPISVPDSVYRGSNGYLRSLRDSYGKYLASPQAVTYKTAFPQQFLPIQALPAHLSQPLAAAATSKSQYRPFAPSYFFGTQYKVPSLYSYSASPTPLTQLGSYSKPLVYAGNIKNVVPVSSFFSRGNEHTAFAPVQQQQATGSKNFYANVPDVPQKSQQQNVPSTHGSAQKLAENNDKGQIQAAPAQTSVTAFVNGKKTVVTLDTNPPIPQVELHLLEPLTFDNPVVPQVQHFLPKLNTATYSKLPAYNIQHSSKKHKDIPVHRINVYNSKDVQIKPKKTTDLKKPRKQNVPVKPQVAVTNDPNEQEFSYEINMPNHKETYNEQVVSYDKQTNTKPVTYAYNKQSQSEPENYSYSHSSKEPLKVTHVEYGDNESPKHLIYTSSPDEFEEESDEETHQRRPESEESSRESNDDEGPVVQPGHSRYDEKKNKHVENNDKYANRHKNYKDDGESSKHFIQNESPEDPSHDSNYQDLPQYHSTQQSPGHVYYTSQQHSHSPRHHKNHHAHHSHSPAHYHHHPHHPHHHNSERTSNPSQNTESHSLKAEHRGEEYKQQPNQEYKQQPNQELQHDVTHNTKAATKVQATPHYYSQPLTVTVQNAIQAITPEYEEDIRILPTNAPQAPQRIQNHPSPSPYPTPSSSTAPHVLEQSNRLIVKEKEETPDTKHTRMEQVMAQMIEEEENDEEDFEKAYKASAFGFPAYEAVTEEAEDGESDVSSPDSYGAPRYKTENYNVDTPFEKYQAEDHPYPKTYKDIQENKKENYYLDFAVNKPNVYADYYKKKADYYKLFKKHKPENTFFENRDEYDSGKIENEDEGKVVASPSYHYPVSPVQKPKQNIYAQYNAPKVVFNYDYSKPSHDSRAYASQPYTYRYKTNFVEPQFQYGFEPVSAPLVLDSELAAMASSDSPESAKPGMRKKVYEENWYIKKTRTAAGEPS